MCLFAEPICALLLPGNPEAAAGTAPLLSLLSVAIAFNCTLYTTNAILQALGHPSIPVVNMAVGGLIKIALSYVLNGIPEINVMGSAISTIVSYFLIMALNFIFIRRFLPIVSGIVLPTVSIVLASGIMGAFSYAAYAVLKLFLPIRAAVLPPIVLAVLVYAAGVVLLHAVNYDDVAMLPKGETIARLLHIRKESRPKHFK